MKVGWTNAWKRIGQILGKQCWLKVALGQLPPGSNESIPVNTSCRGAMMGGKRAFFSCTWASWRQLVDHCRKCVAGLDGLLFWSSRTLAWGWVPYLHFAAACLLLVCARGLLSFALHNRWPSSHPQLLSVCFWLLALVWSESHINHMLWNDCELSPHPSFICSGSVVHNFPSASLSVPTPCRQKGFEFLPKWWVGGAGGGSSTFAWFAGKELDFWALL